MATVLLLGLLFGPLFLGAALPRIGAALSLIILACGGAVAFGSGGGGGEGYPSEAYEVLGGLAFLASGGLGLLGALVGKLVRSLEAEDPPADGGTGPQGG